MVEELEVIYSLFRRFLYSETGPTTREGFYSANWLGPLPWLLEDSDYRLPSILERACRYLVRAGKEDEAKELDRMVRGTILAIKNAEQKIKDEHEVVTAILPNGSASRSFNVESPHWDLYADAEDAAQDICDLCDSLQGYDPLGNPEPLEDGKLQGLLNRWNAAPKELTYDEFAFEETGLYGEGETMRKRLKAFGRKTNQTVRPAQRGRRRNF